MLLFAILFFTVFFNLFSFGSGKFQNNFLNNYCNYVQQRIICLQGNLKTVGASHSGAVSRDFLKNRSTKSKKIKFGKTSWIKTVGKFLEVTFTGTRKVMAVFFSVSFEHIQ